MLHNEKDVGKWNDITCEKVNGFVCQTNLGKNCLYFVYKTSHLCLHKVKKCVAIVID